MVPSLKKPKTQLNKGIWSFKNEKQYKQVFFCHLSCATVYVKGIGARSTRKASWHGTGLNWGLETRVRLITVERINRTIQATEKC